jgi:hypothetical protein
MESQQEVNLVPHLTKSKRGRDKLDLWILKMRLSVLKELSLTVFVLKSESVILN